MPGAATEAIHVPVMVTEVVAWLVTATEGWYVDGTVGAGGHAEAILARLSPEGHLLGLDLDPRTLATAHERLSASAPRVVLRQDSHARLPEILNELRVEKCQGLLLDLGLSSMLLDGGGRGFSFQTDEPLDMRYDPTRGEPLHRLLRELSPVSLADTLRRYGEERHAGRIAAGLHREAVAGQLTTSGALAAAVRAVSRGPYVTKT
ncbi:MAG: 16S rRNA (cytosine(1402)-N(4))-methyltransferase RsmH, partial [Candidatus Neomarinimicrobiota bacterium]